TFQATLIGGWESFSSIQTSRGNIQPDKYVLGEQRGTRENTLNGASRGVLYAGMYRLRLYTSSSDYGDGDSNQIVADQMNENYQGLITGSSKIKLNLSPIPVDAKPVIEIDPIYYSLANEAITINASPIEGYPEFEFEFEWYFNGEQIEQDRTKNPAFLTIDGTKASVGEYRVVVYSNFETKTEKTFEYRNSPDTDGDGLSDYFEQSVFGSDFEKFDSDGDGLSDFEENELRSNPLSSDSDDDGLLDNDEVTITFTRPSRSDTDRNGIDDGAEDFDDDGLDNLSEINNHSTNPFKGDTDSDTILDSVELELGYDPINFTITEDVLFNHEMITIDDPNNQPDANGFGSVDYVYRISKHEISRQMIHSYNSQNSIKIRLPVFETYTAYNDPKKPITDISWNEAARFVNWLNVAKGYPIAYKFKSAGPNSDISLWVPSDEGYDETNPYRNRNAYYFLPSEDEWYKAAFYDPSTNDNQGGYWLFATGSNDAPIALNESSDQNTAIYGLTRRAGPADTIKAGGLSPFGTMAQSGNAAEWCESAFEFPNNSVTKYRVWRGGSLGSLSSSAISSAFRNSAPATGTNGPNMGFRVASKSNDRDNDGLIDSVETNTGIYVSELDTGTDPDVADSDADGLIDSVETNTGVFVDSSNTGTSPHIFDTNQNGNSDSFDVENDIDPTSPLTTIVVLDNFYESVSGQDLIIDATPKVGFPSPTTYQWYLNDIPIEASSGGTENFLTFSGDLADEGTWKVVVTSVGGSTEQTFEY
ncbi:formylglycine-generating enzyme family protein, partial [Akkermansiaceae bacterium]|nr:formylglycine-generating enzyme family protein [Akkermansiaceae bacterium]